MAASPAALTAAVDPSTAAYRTGHKALFFGNGGGVADAQHFAGKFGGIFANAASCPHRRSRRMARL